MVNDARIFVGKNPIGFINPAVSVFPFGFECPLTPGDTRR